MRDSRLASYLTTIVGTQFRLRSTPLVRDVLLRIEKAAPTSLAQPLQLLALRKYLRIQNQRHRDLAAIWALSADDMNRNIRTAPSEDGAATLGWQLMREAARGSAGVCSRQPGLFPGRLAAAGSRSPGDALERQPGCARHGDRAIGGFREGARPA